MAVVTQSNFDYDKINIVSSVNQLHSEFSYFHIEYDKLPLFFQTKVRVTYIPDKNIMILKDDPFYQKLDHCVVSYLKKIGHNDDWIDQHYKEFDGILSSENIQLFDRKTKKELNIQYMTNEMTMNIIIKFYGLFITSQTCKIEASVYQGIICEHHSENHSENIAFVQDIRDPLHFWKINDKLFMKYIRSLHLNIF